MDRLFDGLDDHPATRQLVAATISAELCRKLYAGGVREFHFYTLNRAALSYAICHLLGLRPRAATQEEAAADRKSVEAGKSESGSVYLGGRLILNKNTLIHINN